MRRIILGLLVASLAVLGLAQAQYAAPNYSRAGDGAWIVGGTLDIASGGVISVNGTNKTSALAAAVTTPVAGIAAGYRVARGETALGGTNPTAAATSLTTIVACTVSLKLITAPGVGTSKITYGTSAGTLNLYAWKVTSSTDNTLIASTGTETVGWACVGT